MNKASVAINLYIKPDRAFQAIEHKILTT